VCPALASVVGLQPRSDRASAPLSELRLTQTWRRVVVAAVRCMADIRLPTKSTWVFETCVLSSHDDRLIMGWYISYDCQDVYMP
jgi:hypothetical protein